MGLWEAVPAPPVSVPGTASSAPAAWPGAQRPRAMLCPWRPQLLLLLLLPLPGAGDSEDPGGAGGLRERLRAAAALCRRYWARLGCQVGRRPCEEDQAPGWSLPLLGQQYLDILSTWYCSFGDCCDTGDCRISNDLSGLESDLQGQLHGQPLAQELVLRSVKNYLELDQPDKALALSFHGCSGTGKNFVARLLADNLFRDGLRSDCVHMFIATLHFPHPKYMSLYQEQLTGQIQKMQGHCPQTLFIFDEAEKLHPDLLEVLLPLLKRQIPGTRRTKPQRTFYLFLSNLGGSVISEVVLDLLKAGKSREEITLKQLEPHLKAAILESTDSSFGHSPIVQENLIDSFIPFLPLEYRHVRLCARDVFLSQELPYTEAVLDKIAKMMVYVPKEEKLFSSQGCKSISQRINYFLDS